MRLLTLLLLLSFTWAFAEENATLPQREPDESFSLIPHKKNYIILLGYDLETPQPHDRQPEEVMFQLSLKKKILNKIMGRNIQLYFGYTQKSFWQLYDNADSRPFRETNYNPELYLSIDLLPFIRRCGITHLQTGYEHESNGQATAYSRSWDRLYAQLFATHGPWSGSLKVWQRLPEREKSGPDDPDGDDNPDILEYYGYGELRVDYDYYGHRYELMLRRKAVEASLSVPFGEKAYLFFKWFNGYGESLIDYDRKINRLGVGIQLSR